MEVVDVERVDDSTVTEGATVKVVVTVEVLLLEETVDWNAAAANWRSGYNI